MKRILVGVAALVLAVSTVGCTASDNKEAGAQSYAEVEGVENLVRPDTFYGTGEVEVPDGEDITVYKVSQGEVEEVGTIAPGTYIGWQKNDTGDMIQIQAEGKRVWVNTDEVEVLKDVDNILGATPTLLVSKQVPAFATKGEAETAVKDTKADKEDKKANKIDKSDKKDRKAGKADKADKRDRKADKASEEVTLDFGNYGIVKEDGDWYQVETVNPRTGQHKPYWVEVTEDSGISVEYVYIN